MPGHFPRDAFALARFDGLPLYEHPDPRRGDQPDWGTHVFDFGRLEVRNFLVANALYWLEEFHIDGLRVDAVASMLYLDYSRKDGEWIPNVHGGREHLEAIGLLQEANATAYKRVPGIVTIAEESTSWPGVTKATSSGGLGFGLKWNMGWMNDTLRYLKEEPIHRQYHHNLLTFSLMYAFSENYLLPISHDEVVHGKGSLLTKIPGSREEQLATLRAFLAYMWSHPGKQLLFMGCEFAQPGEWADGRSLDWWLLDHAAHYRVHALVKELNRVYQEHPAMWALDSQPAGFRWLDADDNTGNVLSYLRFAQHDQQGDVVATVVNYSGDDKAWVRVGVPAAGPLGGRARHQRVRRGQQPEPGRRGARGRGVAVARPAVVGHRAGRQAVHRSTWPRPRAETRRPGGKSVPPGPRPPGRRPEAVGQMKSSWAPSVSSMKSLAEMIASTPS